MDILNYKLQPEDVEKFCINCKRVMLKHPLEEVYLKHAKTSFHVDNIPASDRLSFRKLTTQEIFLIQIML